jgi:hypothetical protein
MLFEITKRYARYLAWVLVPSAAYAAPVDDLKALLDDGKAAEAYAEAKKHPEQIGDPTFDFFYGVAAVATGNAGEGVLALERYLLAYPDNVTARLHLARGYFLLGEDARAREEFEALRQSSPPPDIAATIDRFLDAIRLRETRYRPSAGGYVELGVGNDSNVNSGISGSTAFLPTFGPVIISQNGQAIRTDFASVGAGGYVSYPMAPGVALFGNAALEQKFNDGNSQYQFGTLDLAGGVSVLREKNLYKVALSQGYITLGNRGYRDATGAGAEVRHQLDELNSVGIGAQYAQLRYNDPNGPQDANFWGINAGYRHQFTGSWQPAVTFAANYGEQHSTQSRPDLVPRTKGLAAGLTFTPAAKWGVALGVNYLASDYLDINFLAGEARRDQYRTFNGIISYLISRNLSIRAEALVARNSSNIDLYAFQREVFTLKMRYEFK